MGKRAAVQGRPFHLVHAYAANTHHHLPQAKECEVTLNQRFYPHTETVGTLANLAR